MFLFIFIGFWLASMVGGYFVDSHPIFFIFTLVITIFLGFIGAVYTNIFIEFAEMSTFSGIAESYTSILFVMRNLPLFLVAGSITVAVFTVSKNAIFK
jgi:hypothetical protein